MAPNSSNERLKVPLQEETKESKESISNRKVEDTSQKSETIPFKPVLLPMNIAFLAILHLIVFYGFFFYTAKVKLSTFIFAFFIWPPMTAFGITAGAHRLWTHRSYKARWPLRVLLIIFYSMAGQNPLFHWVRDHRVHHKYSETDADPHNANRGFFFAHMGWLMQKKHPEVIKKGKSVDMSDILADPVVTFHRKYYYIFTLTFAFVLPIFLPCYLWNETLVVSFFWGMIRYAGSLHSTWFVNSAAHMWGYKPYDKRISPTENWAVSIVAYGEGWHNYHHVFPWDYKTAELGNYEFNLTTLFLDICGKLGLAYDFKQPSKELVYRMARKFGDGSHVNCPSTHEVDENGNVTNCCQDEEGDMEMKYLKAS